MKRRDFTLWTAVIATLGLAACGGGSEGWPSVATADGLGIRAEALSTQLATMTKDALSAAEADSLTFMRQEESLAQSVYTASAVLWPNQPIFANIASSEATHTAAVKTLLDRYQLPDPLAGLPLGSFLSPEFNALYATLTAASKVSQIRALQVGAQIEELDMRDIKAQMASVDNSDILLVYDNLLRGSRNHLRSFMKVLLALGGSYTPQYISQAEFDAIINSPMETGP